MKFVSVLLLTTCASAYSLPKALYDSRIVGGSIAKPGQFPYQVCVRYTGEQNCGGSILDTRTILTAAHCVDDFLVKDTDIAVGSNTLAPSGDVYPVSHFVLHKSWNPTSVLNDIAIIKLKTPIVLKANVQPIALDYNSVTAGVPCVISGWGLTTYPGVSPNDLFYLDVKVVDLKECKQKFADTKYTVEGTHICAIGLPRQGACQGDSGGPLVANKKQIGIASWGDLCALGKPDVYTRISSYTNWILANKG